MMELSYDEYSSIPTSDRDSIQFIPITVFLVMI